MTGDGSESISSTTVGSTPTPTTPGDLLVRMGSPEDAPALAEALTGAPADDDLVERVRRWLADGLCVLAETDEEPAHPLGALQLVDVGGHAEVHTLVVVPEQDEEVVGTALLRGAAQVATDLGSPWLRVRGFSAHPAERVALRRLLVEKGYRPDGEDLVGALPVRVEVPDGPSMQALGAWLTALLEPGDLVLASGDLGAGKTTLTQGIGLGLGVDSPVISPTFVLVRRHRGQEGRAGLVHVDAYRLGSGAELVDLDLDETMADNVTVVEWGAGIAEDLDQSHLSVDIRRSGDPDDETRTVYVEGVGPRWRDVDLAMLSYVDLLPAPDPTLAARRSEVDDHESTEDDDD